MAEIDFAFCFKFPGDFLPISRGWILATFPIENSHLFSQYMYHVHFSQIKKIKKNLFLLFIFYFFRDHYYLWETMTHIRMILKYLCFSGMLDIIQHKITWYWGYILLPVVNFTHFDVKSIIFSQFLPGAFPQNCWKNPWFLTLSSLASLNLLCSTVFCILLL